jgi:hypothetical protein
VPGVVNERAWCFQEQVLSSRILEFGTYQLRYRCPNSREEGAVQQTDGWITNSETYQHQGKGGGPLCLPPKWMGFPAHSEELLDIWGSVVIYYSYLSLSYHNDRLHAISAIARRLQYPGDSSHLNALDDTYRAPSWSWALIRRPHWYGFSVSILPGSQVVPIDVFVENGSKGDDFSDVITAELRICALTLVARLDLKERVLKPWWASDSWKGWDAYLAEDPDDPWRKEPEDLEYSQTLSPWVIDPVTGISWKSFGVYCDEWLTMTREVLLVQLSSCERGLILALQPGSATKYIRIGIFRREDSSIPGDVPEDIPWKEREETVV